MMERLELKFLAEHPRVDGLLAALAPWIQRDPRPCYRVRTLYFDTPALDGYREKLDGQPERTRVRLRFYPDEGSTYIEIRRRWRDRVAKRRAPGLAAALLGEAGGDAGGEPTAQAARAQLRARGERPQLVTSYRREAFRDRSGRVRLTVDRGLRCRRSSGDWPIGAGRTFAVPPELAVLELKTPDEPPSWLARALAAQGLERARFSKYTAAVEALALAAR